MKHPQPPIQSSERATREAAERQKTAIENTSEGYGGNLKSRHISAKPDGDTAGGPGANNPNAKPPLADDASARPPR